MRTHPCSSRERDPRTRRVIPSHGRADRKNKDCIPIKKYFFTVIADFCVNMKESEANDEMMESIDELKERLSAMKRMMRDREEARPKGKDIFDGQARSLKGASMITGNFLGFVFGAALFVIGSVSIYAFYNLYHAVLKRFPSKHTEL